jgi:hypothetical protein
MVGVTLSRDGDLLSERRFLELERVALVLERGTLELERTRSSSACSSSTSRRRSSTYFRGSLFSWGGATLASDGWGAASITRSEQRTNITNATKPGELAEPDIERK